MSVFSDFVSFWNEVRDLQDRYMKKVIGIDYGTRKIGVAVSDDSRAIAFPKEVLINDWNDVHIVVELIKDLCKKYHSNILIIGFPKQLNGEMTKNCIKIIEIANLLNQFYVNNNENIAILLFDERFTTKAATSVLRTKLFIKNKAKMSIYKTNNKNNNTAKHDDARAACILLNDALKLEKTITS